MSPNPNARAPCQRPTECTTPRIPIELLQESILPSCQPDARLIREQDPPDADEDGQERKSERARRQPHPEALRPRSDVVGQRDQKTRAGDDEHREPETPGRLSSDLRGAPQPESRQPLRRARASGRATCRISRTCASLSPRSVARCEWNGRARLRGAPSRKRLLEREPAHVERRRPELRPELVERGERVLGEQMFHHPYLAVVVERNVDVRMRDEVERQPATARTAHREPHRTVGRREQREGRREHRTCLPLRKAEEAPRPLASPDVPGCELAELGARPDRAARS